jgi:hypothetical protein
LRREEGEERMEERGRGGCRRWKRRERGEDGGGQEECVEEGGGKWVVDKGRWSDGQFKF